ncbi:hypothetical protein HaLaN_00916 [Haematococcus lacustris]|uniref:Uncharacterized protein n=1 Tax=Haematococcus lacustris TaxID=44745 RepID=A0A699Y804_HAELA|nr:hypothetical protein HaLaN_00916 [Haematococcus lacustris]
MFSWALGAAPLAADHLRGGVLPPQHGGAQGPEAREPAAGRAHEREDRRLWAEQHHAGRPLPEDQLRQP